LQSAINNLSAHSSILVLNGTITENVSTNKAMYIVGQGYGSYLNGTFTCTRGFTFGTMIYIRVNQFILNSGADGNIINSSFWVSAPLDSGTAIDISGITV